MRRIGAILCLLFLLIVLYGCVPENYSYNKNDLEENIRSVELIYYTNEDQQHFSSWSKDQTSSIKDFDFSRVEVIEMMDNSKINEFIKIMPNINFLSKYFSYDSPKGTCIRINYNNGDFDILSCIVESKSNAGIVCRYSSDGKVKEFMGIFKFYYDFEFLNLHFFDRKPLK